MSDQHSTEATNEYADSEHIEHTSSGTGLALPGQNLPDKVYICLLYTSPSPRDS